MLTPKGEGAFLPPRPGLPEKLGDRNVRLLSVEDANYLLNNSCVSYTAGASWKSGSPGQTSALGLA